MILKKSILIVTILLSTTVICFGVNSHPKNQINFIIGDISFVKKFGLKPNSSSDENLRIQTHLEYVESLLRAAPVSHLSANKRENRKHLMDLLHTYWKAGKFPVNYDYPNTRIPCFIDKNGTICAVGYLIEKTAGRTIAEKINTSHQYETIFEMKDPLVENWIEINGLTKKECAMIQPTYGWEPNPEPNPISDYPPNLFVEGDIGNQPTFQMVANISADVKLQIKIRSQAAQIDSLNLIVTNLEKLTDSLSAEIVVQKNSKDSLENLVTSQDLLMAQNASTSNKKINLLYWIIGLMFFALIATVFFLIRKQKITLAHQ